MMFLFASLNCGHSVNWFLNFKIKQGLFIDLARKHPGYLEPTAWYHMMDWDDQVATPDRYPTRDFAWIV